MKRIWGMILVCGFLASQVSHAEEWTPFIGTSLLPNLNFIYSEYEPTDYKDENKTLYGFTNGSLEIKAGLEKENLSVIAHYYMTNMPGPWSEYNDSTSYPNGQPTVNRYEMSEWKEFHITLGVRHYPRLPEKAKSKLYLGAGMGFGKAAYSEYSNEVGEGPNMGRRVELTFERGSQIFFKQYAELGIATQVGKDVNMILGFTLQHATVPLDERKQNPRIRNNIENWTAALEFGILYYIR